MSEEIENLEDERDEAGPAGDGIERAPRGNPDRDDEAVEKGVETLERVKPY
jgi:hypothetical protein